jgi:glycosyltransferase involved in cell wall biosynthesis
MRPGRRWQRCGPTGRRRTRHAVDRTISWTATGGISPGTFALGRYRRLLQRAPRTLPDRPSNRMPGKRIVISANAAWNIVNFRSGLIRALQARGHEIIAIAPPDEHAARVRALDVDFHPIAMNKQGLSPAADLALLLRYRRLLAQVGADTFLGYTAKPNIYGSLAAQSLGMQVINNVSGLGTAFIRGGWLLRLVAGLYRVALRRSSTIFFQNADDRNLFVSEGLARPEQARVLPGSGVDLVQFAPQSRAILPEQPFRFILVGRLIRDKGVMEYVSAARRLRPRWPDVRFQLLGAVDAENRTAISSEMVEDWVREGVVDYLGEAEDVRPFLASADCVVLPSYREGLPRTLLEAAAMGRPIIATDVPGCREVARNDVNAFLCFPRDASSLAGAMERMLLLPEAQRAAFGTAARAMVEAEYGEQRVVASYLQAIDRG